MEELKGALLEFVKKCQSGDVFSVKIESLFDSVNVDDEGVRELVDGIRTILKQKVLLLTSFFDRKKPLTEIDGSFEYLYEDPSNSVLKPYLDAINAIFDVWICEMIRWNNKPNSYDFFHIKRRLKENHDILKVIINDYGISELNGILLEFQKVIDDSLKQEIRNNDISSKIQIFISECSRYARYVSDDKIGIIYDIGYTVREKPDFDFKKNAKDIFQELHLDNQLSDDEINSIFNRKDISADLLSKLNEVDLALIFAYYKDVLYLSEGRLKFDKLLGLFKRFYEVLQVPENGLDKKIYNWNKGYFYNYLVSCLINVIDNKDFERIQSELLLIKRNIVGKTYFTAYKEASLQLSLAKYKIDSIETSRYIASKNSEIEKDTEVIFEKANEAINNCFAQYLNTNESNLSPFIIPVRNINTDGKPFSFRKIFAIPNKPNFEEKIVFLQGKIVETELRLKMVITQKKLQEMENQMGKQDYRQIEILGIFSAFILFTAGTIQVYQYLGSVSSAIIFTSCFGALLMGFMALIKSLSPGTDNKWGYLLFGLICIILSFAGGIILKNSSSDIKMLNKEFIDGFKNELINEIETNTTFTNQIRQILEKDTKNQNPK